MILSLDRGETSSMTCDAGDEIRMASVDSQITTLVLQRGMHEASRNRDLFLLLFLARCLVF